MTTLSTTPITIPESITKEAANIVNRYILTLIPISTNMGSDKTKSGDQDVTPKFTKMV